MRWLKTTLKGSMYQELPSELVTPIEKLLPLLPHKEMEETLENDKSFLKLDHG